MNIREFNDVILFDGSMGNYFSKIFENPFYKCEQANVSHPEVIKNIHVEYLEAGANAIKTNTFCLEGLSTIEKREIIKAGYSIACDCAKKYGAFVFADIGYISSEEDCDKLEKYKEIVDVFIECGATNFLFETLSDDIAIEGICRYIKDTVENPFVIISFAVQADGVTSKGYFFETLYNKYKSDDYIDCVGLNCVCGPAHLYNIAKTVSPEKLSIMPNAGYPTTVSNRIVYMDNPVYFAKKMIDILELSVKVIGGCCGTTPEFINEIRKGMKNANFSTSNFNVIQEDKTQNLKIKNKFYDKLISKEKAVAVELDSPLKPDLSKFMENAKILKKNEVDAITIADCPIARSRMDSSLLACKLKRELNIDVIPHLTCRDRNLNASKALLLGLSAEEIQNLLIVTGDPVPSVLRDEIKTVYQFNSKILTNHITSLNETLFTSPFSVYSAINLNAKNFDAQLKSAKEKVENGSKGFFTQPIHSKYAVENLKRLKNTLDVPVMAGILPIVSYKNAMYMANEIPGITIPPEIISKYKEKSKEESFRIAVNISNEIVDEIYDYADGFYLITLFGRVDIISEVITYIKNKENY